MGALNEIKEVIGQNSAYKRRVDELNLLADKWEQYGLLDGLKGVERLNMAQLLENQGRRLIFESTHTGTTAGSEEWSGVALPLVRKVFDNISAKEFMSVQPMNLPSGLVFFIDYVYGTSKTGYTAASGEGNDYIHGDTQGTDAPQGGFYGAGRFGYSYNDVGQDTGTSTTASLTWANVDFNDELSSSISDGSIKRLSFATASSWNIDVEGIRAFNVTSSVTGEICEVYPAYTRISGANIQFVVSGSTSGSLSDHHLVYHKRPPYYNRGDFEDQSDTNVNIPEIEFKLRQKSISVVTRKLKAIWTPEVQQDMNAYQAIDAEAELTNMLGEHVSMEVDKELLDMLILNTDQTEYWSAIPGYEINTAKTGFARNSAYTIPSPIDWYQTLMIKIKKVSNKIHSKTLRGGANFMVVSPDVATVLESIPGYSVDTDGSKKEFAMGVKRIGELAHTWTTYKNPYMKANTILLGFKGPTYLETGAAYCPYIPLLMTPVVYHQDNFTPRKAVMTRYAKTILRKEFYGKIVIHGLNRV